MLTLVRWLLVVVGAAAIAWLIAVNWRRLGAGDLRIRPAPKRD
jgi:hypothetical protein